MNTNIISVIIIISSSSSSSSSIFISSIIMIIMKGHGVPRPTRVPCVHLSRGS